MTLNPVKNFQNGFILLDKPQGLSSNQALQQVKRLLGLKKAGHTGNLDPLATGLLPIAAGEAAKFSQFLLDADKTYRAVAKLGIRTDTYDREGKIIEENFIPDFSKNELNKILDGFKGTLNQTAPSYSALKYQGKPSYYWARKGIEIPKKIRTIEIYSIELLDHHEDEFSIEVSCSKGTYIRSLIDDIGQALGCGAHLQALRRTKISGLPEDMITLEQLTQCSNDKLPYFSIGQALTYLPSIQLNEQQALAIKQGKKIHLDAPSAKETVFTLFDEAENFIGIGSQNQFELAAKRLMSF